MLTETYLEPSRTSVEFFSLWLSHMVKTYLVPFRFHFLHNSPFREKTYDSENFGRKTLLLTMKHFFFLKFEITQWNGVINKEGFLN